MASCCDLVERLGPDALSVVLTILDDPADLVRIVAVSRSLRRFHANASLSSFPVVADGLAKKLCLRKFPEASVFFTIAEISSSSGAEAVGSCTSSEFEILKREHKVYSYLSHFLVSCTADEYCIGECIGASSTDNDPAESIVNTLEPLEEVAGRPSYWSSKGSKDAAKSEMLTYRLKSKVCVVTKFCVQPFEAYFQYDHPMYSSRNVRIRMGYEKANIKDKETSSRKLDDSKYIWTYVSPEFPMAQENVLQYFELPRPAICLGGIVQIELLGRVQKQEIDDLYYICVTHANVTGQSLSPVFDFDSYGTRPVLKYFPDAKLPSKPDDAPSRGTRDSGWHSFTETFRQIRSRAWNRVIMRAVRGDASTSHNHLH